MQQKLVTLNFGKLIGKIEFVRKNATYRNEQIVAIGAFEVPMQAPPSHSHFPSPELL